VFLLFLYRRGKQPAIGRERKLPGMFMRYLPANAARKHINAQQLVLNYERRELAVARPRPVFWAERKGVALEMFARLDGPPKLAT
jgi:hypothetical protein